MTGAISKNCATLLVSYSEKQFSEFEKEIIQRFGHVFEQAYIRFLDLQKSEAQAREAQIETTLEKVRSRSLAMHKSDELKEVVSIVFEKLKELNVKMDAVCIITFIPGTKDHIQWVANPNILSSILSVRVEYFDVSLNKAIFDALDEGLDFYHASWSFEEKNN